MVWVMSHSGVYARLLRGLAAGRGEMKHSGRRFRISRQCRTAAPWAERARHTQLACKRNSARARLNKRGPERLQARFAPLGGGAGSANACWHGRRTPNSVPASIWSTSWRPIRDKQARSRKTWFRTISRLRKTDGRRPSVTSPSKPIYPLRWGSWSTPAVATPPDPG